ncbi:MAG: DUF190 domain-containing protein [Deltaproteobacteria bacterium]|nr:DUF190 domain-containing protein [Deltaproteobacteria bacterium]
MRRLTGTQTLMRIFIGEDDRAGRKSLCLEIVELLRKEKIAGATVLRGILGFGAKSHLHTGHLLRLSQDLPIVIEVVDSRENIDRVLPRLDALMGEGLVTLENVTVLRYAPGESVENNS